MAQNFEHLSYWREGPKEVDFVIEVLGQVVGIEVKSGRKKNSGGREAFLKKVPGARFYWVTGDNFSEFSKNPEGFLSQ